MLLTPPSLHQCCNFWQQAAVIHGWCEGSNSGWMCISQSAAPYTCGWPFECPRQCWTSSLAPAEHSSCRSYSNAARIITQSYKKRTDRLWQKKTGKRLLRVRRNCWEDNVRASRRNRTACRYEATPGRLIIWCPLKLIFFKFGGGGA